MRGAWADSIRAADLPLECSLSFPQFPPPRSRTSVRSVNYGVAQLVHSLPEVIQLLPDRIRRALAHAAINGRSVAHQFLLIGSVVPIEWLILEHDGCGSSLNIPP